MRLGHASRVPHGVVPVDEQIGYAGCPLGPVGAVGGRALAAIEPHAVGVVVRYHKRFFIYYI